MNISNSTSTSLRNLRVNDDSFGIGVLAKLLPITVAVTFTNGLVLVMFYKRKSLHTASNYLLLSLASSDFLTGTVCIPFFIAFSFDGIIPYNSLAAHLMYVIQTLLAISGSYHILVITGDMHFQTSFASKVDRLEAIFWRVDNICSIFNCFICLVERYFSNL